MNTAHDRSAVDQSKLRALIVDDEALARRGLELRLAHYPQVEVVGQCANGRDALAAIRAQRPDIVFLDIEMPGLSGFDVLAELQPHELPLIVFVTAYDVYAIRAFEARAVDYLLKPVEDNRLSASIEHALGVRQQRSAVADRDRLIKLLAAVRGSGELAPSEAKALPTASPPAQADGLQPTTYGEFLPIRTGREIVRVPMRSIDWIDAAGDYLCVHAAGVTHILRATMKDMEHELDPQLFQRVHRSTIVNLARVASLRAHMNGEYFLKLTGGQELKLSRSYRDKLEHFLARPGAANH
jgi:two-component system LytT family response regulator